MPIECVVVWFVSQWEAMRHLRYAWRREEAGVISCLEVMRRTSAAADVQQPPLSEASGEFLIGLGCTAREWQGHNRHCLASYWRGAQEAK